MVFRYQLLLVVPYGANIIIHSVVLLTIKGPLSDRR